MIAIETALYYLSTLFDTSPPKARSTGGGIGQWLACLGSRSGDPGSTPTEYISYTLGKGILPPLSRELCGRCMVIE